MLLSYQPGFQLNYDGCLFLLTLDAEDGMNRLTRQKVVAITDELRKITSSCEFVSPLVISAKGNFSVGADLNEIMSLTGPHAYVFSAAGQALMHKIATFPAPVIAAIDGYCMGGGLDLALACHRRIAAPSAVFGHRGASLGLITGWGGTQRLPRLIGKARALELFVTGEKISATRALEIGLVDSIADVPVRAAANYLDLLSREES